MTKLTDSLGAHGQVVAEVRFAVALGPKLVRRSTLTPNRTRLFQLGITRGALVLASLPR